MATLAAASNRTYELGQAAVLNDIPMIASDTIYAGAAVGESSSTGNARPLQGGDAFMGFALATVTNGTTVGENTVRVKSRGVVTLTVANVTADDDYGITIYASDDDTFTTASTSNTAIGKLARWVSGTTCMVAFEAATHRSI